MSFYTCSWILRFYLSKGGELLVRLSSRPSTNSGPQNAQDEAFWALFVAFWHILPLSGPILSLFGPILGLFEPILGVVRVK